MNAKIKKIIITITIVIVTAALLVVFCLWLSFGKDLEIKAALETEPAKVRAQEYFVNNYGEELKIARTEPYIPGSFFYGHSFEGIIVYPEEGDWSILVRDDYIADNRQYDEITEGFKEKYFGDVRLAEINETEIFMHFRRRPEDGDTFHKFTEVYYDGDIEKFLDKVQPDVRFGASYESDSEKPYDPEDYRGYIKEKLAALKASSKGEVKGDIYIYEPAVGDPQMPCIFRDEIWGSLSGNNGSRKGEIKIYEKNLMKEDGIAYVYDQRDNKYLELKSVDLSENILTDFAESDTALQIREKGYAMNTSGYDGVYLRLDREHYNITDCTVPLLVTENTDGRRVSYRLDGNGRYYWHSCCYMNDKYLYIYIEDLLGLGQYLAFADLDEEEFAEFFSVETDI
ncbi:MAG: hypothetical protein K2N72_03645 [Oscillospiraceae bacterium]|nr:hypothetical protein [Oscillospiraceae bacterium]